MTPRRSYDGRALEDQAIKALSAQLAASNKAIQVLSGQEFSLSPPKIESSKVLFCVIVVQTAFSHEAGQAKILAAVSMILSRATHQRPMQDSPVILIDFNNFPKEAQEALSKAVADALQSGIVERLLDY